MFARGKPTAHQLEAGTDEIAAQVAEIDEQIARAGQASVLGQLIGAEDVLAAWKGLDLQRQRAVVKRDLPTILATLDLSPAAVAACIAAAESARPLTADQSGRLRVLLRPSASQVPAPLAA